MTNQTIIELLKNTEIKWQTLGDVLVKVKAKSISAKLLKELKVINEDDVRLISTGNFDGFTTLEKADKYLNEGEIITIPTGGTANLKYWNGKFVNSLNHVFTSETDNVKYIYHFLLKNNVLIQSYFRGSSVKHPHISSILNLKIPIPPLETQQQIVEILDKFTGYVTELTAELTAELTLREQQYAYYREQLLTFDDEKVGGTKVEWLTLNKVAKLKNGRDWKGQPDGNVPVYGSGGEMKMSIGSIAYDKTTVLIPRKGSISNIFYLENTPFWNVDTIYYTEIDESKIIPKYFYYYLTTLDLESMSTNPTRPSLTQAIIDKIKIPLPSLAEQARIVAILDKFDTLTSSISEGLPREIELRQQQYEYYREQLLSFKD